MLPNKQEEKLRIEENIRLKALFKTLADPRCREDDHKELLEGALDAYDVSRGQLSKNQKAIQLYYLSEFADIQWPEQEKSSLLPLTAFSNPGFLPPEVKDKSKQMTTLRDRGMFAPGRNDCNRQYSKYRVLIGPVYDVVLNKNINILTGCAPNLMTSPKDIEKYIIDRNKLNRKEYNETCLKIAELFCAAAKKQGYNKMVMPDFGLGVYLKKLTDERQREIARECMYGAFARAAEHYRIKIDWVIFGKGIDTTIQKKYNNKFFNFDQGDIFARFKEADDKTVFINPGSDRTVGGDLWMENPRTLEEQDAQRTQLIATMSAGMNSHLKAQFTSRNQQKCIIPQLQPTTSAETPETEEKREAGARPPAAGRKTGLQRNCIIPQLQPTTSAGKQEGLEQKAERPAPLRNYRKCNNLLVNRELFALQPGDKPKQSVGRVLFGNGGGTFFHPGRDRGAWAQAGYYARNALLTAAVGVLIAAAATATAALSSYLLLGAAVGLVIYGLAAMCFSDSTQTQRSPMTM